MSTIHGIASRSVKPAVHSDSVIHAAVCVRSNRTDERTDGRTDANRPGVEGHLYQEKIKTKVIPVISVKQQGQLYRREVPGAMSAKCESSLGSTI